ncbi:MAG: DinB family protein [Chloroflexales bacterium]|nr:DinB family protein [Chloroflexales bacterium]
MPADLSNAGLNDLIAEARALSDDVQHSFGRLTALQLNWKPNPDEWSVGQCVDHIITANASYVPIITRITSGEKQQNTLWERMPILPTFFGHLLKQVLKPDSPQKISAPKAFRPSSSVIDAQIVQRFLDQQQQVIAYMQASEKLDVAKINITSPALPVITYSLLDAYRIIIIHERHHLVQSRRLLTIDGFPNA